MKYTFFKR